MAFNKETFIEDLKSMTVLEVADLVKTLEEEFGISAAAPVAVAGAVAGAAVEEQTEFSVVLTGAGSNKIAAIKVVRAITGLGLKEAKALVEAAPKALKEGLEKSEAEALLKQVTDAGAEAELK